MFNFSPPKGGLKIPPLTYFSIIEELDVYSACRPWCHRFKLQPRFKNQFCYLDASENSQNAFPLGRLRYFGPKKWSLDFYTYSNERYEPCLFPTGKWYGTLEQAVDVCEMYLV